MISLGQCPLCQDGKLGFRLCSDRQTVVVLCDTCAMIWGNPDKLDEAHAFDPLDPNLRRKHPGADLRPSQWARPEDVEAFGWGRYLITPESLLEAPVAEKGES